MKVFKLLNCLLCLVLLFSGCGQQSINVNKYAVTYLSSCNVTKSKITYLDYEEIQKLHITYSPPTIKFLENRIDEILESFYDIKISDKKIVEKYDVVVFNIKTSYNQNVTKEENVHLLIGNGYMGKNIENKMLGAKVGNIFTTKNESNIFNNYNKDAQIEIEILGILEYKQLPETENHLFENNFKSFSDYYNYLFEIKLNEYEYEEKIQSNHLFFEEIIKNCEFEIAEEDLQNYTMKIVEEYDQVAQSFNLTIEEYFEDVLELTEEEFFLSCTDDAEYEIKRCLIVGALAEYFDLDIMRDNSLSKFCLEKGITLNENEKEDVIIKYYCLENELLKRFI